YVVKGAMLSASLPDDFFDRTKPSAPPGAVAAVPAEAVATTVQLKTAIENRLFEMGSPGAPAKGKVTVAGYVTDVRNGEPIAGVSIAVDSLAGGVFTDRFGYYSLTLPPGRHLLRFSSVGMKTTSRQVLLHGDGKLPVELSEYVPSLKEVVVTANRLSNVRSLAMGRERLSIQTIKQIPVVFGEADVLRATLMLPGVTSVGEANTGLNVRGGAADQNLILLNDATIYNPSHLFGFFSAFNPDIVKGVELYKSAVPEKYGGRLSSVLDVTTKQGNTKKISGAAGIGPLTSKLTVEGPLAKDKTTFIAGARSSYSNWLLNQVPNSAYQNSQASFYDADLHLSHTVNSKNSLFLNGYFSHDDFRLNGDTSYRYGNRNLNLKWKHNFNNQFYGIATAGVDAYRYALSSESNPVNAYQLSFGIRQNFLRTDFTFTPSLKHLFTFGASTVYYQLQPGELAAVGQGSLVQAEKIADEQGLETALYLGDEYTLSSRLSLHAGFRYSFFNYLGPRDVYGYRAGLPRDSHTLVDTTSYADGKVIKTYHRPEVRLSVRYTLSDQSSVKASFNTMTQYIHTLSNTNSISPTDVLKLSDPYLLPQEGRQVSAGFYRNFRSNSIETSVELYYKQMQHYLDYKSGAALLLNPHIETDVIDTKGKAYGVEVLVKKTSGKLTGWVGYTFSRVQLQSADSAAGEKINGGRWYPANFDKPHNTNFVGNYKFSHRYNVSLGITYSTGRPITLPLAVFDLGGSQRVYYSERNQFRTPDYFRADLSVVLEGNHKLSKPTHNDWTFGVYNLTGRKNVYSIYFIEENGQIKGYKLSIFGTLIPFVTYTLRF
ncbi:MAG TPA: TonB-dependent receptor, partial [Flavisolibacter sp.]|nr:TonB-dependent receptor [Flavisolibacter sp.]